MLFLGLLLLLQAQGTEPSAGVLRLHLLPGVIRAGVPFPDKMVLRPFSQETVSTSCLPPVSIVRVPSLFMTTRCCLLGQDAEPGFRGPQLRLEAASADAAAPGPSTPYGGTVLRVDTQDLPHASVLVQARAPCMQACLAVYESASPGAAPCSPCRRATAPCALAMASAWLITCSVCHVCLLTEPCW